MGQEIDPHQFLRRSAQPTGQAGQAPVPQHDWNRRQIARHSRSPVVFAQGVEIVVVEDAGNDDFREFGQGQTGIKPVVVATSLPAGSVLDHTAGVRLETLLHRSKIALDDALGITSPGRCVLDADAEGLGKCLNLGAVQFALIGQYHIRQTLDRPIAGIDLQTILATILDLVGDRVGQCHHGTDPGGPLESDVHTNDHAAEHVEHHVNDRPADDKAAVML